MTTQEVHVSLQNLITTPWGQTEEMNRRAIGDGWELAETFASLHTEGARRISRAAGARPTKSDQATILLACHGLNLFIQTTGLIIRGLFDVSAHLLRGLMDTQSLVYVCASDSGLATKYLDSKFEASKARRLLVAAIRSKDEALADDLDRQFKDDADAANDLAHVRALHGYKLLKAEGGKITPVAGGVVDGDEARRQLKAALDAEHWLLLWFKSFRQAVVGEDWIGQFDDSEKRFHSYMKS